ncbi:MAG: heparinase II/III family protein [Melioribacteraceae bacterium]|nr:heparinase II/III family protein [Melioribacteraceae bacterium]
MKEHIKNIFISLIVISSSLWAQKAVDLIIPDSVFVKNLVSLNEEIERIKLEYKSGDKDNALKKLAGYFSNKMSERYFIDWKTFKQRIVKYKMDFPDRLKEHERRAEEHIALFDAVTSWELPLTGKDDTDITPYLLRHLARQHKALDIAFLYSLHNENDVYLNYIVEQVNSLASSYYSGKYDKEGNAVFESFRAGYRIYNWLFVYNAFLASDKFNWRDQLDFIKTFKYHSNELMKETKKFRYGNHHTKGLTALAITSILFPEFNNSNENLEKSLGLLTEHMTKEIKPDGFQFERTVHYHKGDIDNYFYVYQLAKLNGIDISAEYESRFKKMFSALVRIAMPNKKLPVLQDDTDEPWAEFNNMNSAMTIGSILFEDPKFKYFTNNKIPSGYFWFFRESDITKFQNMKSMKPNFNSVGLVESGYYIMRNGWDEDSDYFIISAGLSDRKPDHQHGDMLGLYGYSKGNVILPNYQCRYFLDDYNFFKNSFVKNVALADSIPQGQMWKGNRGGSGFGKFEKLPTPKTLCWINREEYDLFIGTHDAYSNLDVEYFRKVIFIKDGFLIVKDEFFSDEPHNYQQVWQGHFSIESPEHIMDTYPDGSGLSIFQLNKNNYKNSFGSFRGKGNAVVNSEKNRNYNFTTLVYPFNNFDGRLILEEDIKFSFANSWTAAKNYFNSEKLNIFAENIISNDSMYVSLNTTELKFSGNKISVKGDFIIEIKSNGIEILSVNLSPVKIDFEIAQKVKKIDSEIYITESLNLKPGEQYTIISEVN